MLHCICGEIHSQKFRIDSLESTLKEAFCYDQQIRNLINNSTSKSEIDSLYSKMNIIDNLNQEKVLPIIDYIIDNKIITLSDSSYTACFLILQHSPLNTQFKYKKFITLFYQKGLIENYELLLYLDRINVYQNLAQVYGSQVIKMPNDIRIIYPTISYNKRKSAFEQININIENFCVIDGITYINNKIDSIKHKKNINIIQYDAIEIEHNEFAIIGYIATLKDSNIGAPNIKIGTTDKIMATTDKNGYFEFKVNEKEIPEIIYIYNEEVEKYKLKNTSGNFCVFAYKLLH